VLGGPFFHHATACGGANTPTLAASGDPMLGGAVSFALTVPSPSLALLWIGFPASSPLCSTAGCALGASMASLRLGTTMSLQIPQDPVFLGSIFSVQGAAVFATGGCLSGTIPYTVSDTVDFMIQ
jgi:hypothetical protein